MSESREARFDRANGDAKQLPLWFRPPVPCSRCQTSLFPRSLAEVLAELRVSADELQRWHDSGWLSFGPDRTDPLEDWDSNAIHFVRDVVRSGLSDALIAAHFEHLPRPMSFDPHSIAFSFSLGWVVARNEPEPDPSDVVDEHIVDWLTERAEGGERGRLEEIRDRILGLLASMQEADDKDSE